MTDIRQLMDPNRPDWVWVTEDTKKFLSGGYLEEGETVQKRFEDIGLMMEDRIGEPGLAEKFVHAGARGWLSPSSPVWASAARSTGLPISCNNSNFGDSIEQFADKLAEMMVMTKYGAGTSAWIGDMRPRGSKISTGGIAYGPSHYSPMIESVVKTTSQKGYRRGSWAAYFPIYHPDAPELINRFQNDNDAELGDTPFGVTITDEFFERVISYSLDKKVEFEKEAKLWLLIMKKSIETGYPYLIYHDNANKYSPEIFQRLALEILGSNLCTEIFLPSTSTESFVCDLSSENVFYWDEYRDWGLHGLGLKLLDAVMSEYIDKTAHIKHMESPHRFAVRHRAVGLGVLGLHSLFQRKDLPWASEGAFELNKTIFKEMDAETRKVSLELAEKHGPAPIFDEVEGYEGPKYRNSTRLAVAPTKSSCTIMGNHLSQGIQPFTNNASLLRRAKGWYQQRNPFLEMALEEEGLNTDETWNEILFESGSVQTIEGLSEHRKNVYKNFREIDQSDILLMAAHRQIWIDQGQSVNVSYDNDEETMKISMDQIFYWRLGGKSRYYQNNKKIALDANQEAARKLHNLKKARKNEIKGVVDEPTFLSSAEDEFGVECLACSA
uniref:Ribonucleoside-diphosphate reductase large subunit n=1 Tax=Ochrobactrum phage ORM_20 TaxID=2985243 RepID=A0A9N6WZP7_9VIRU|nr:ribonucleoside-diphosphate reductase large subunit [Ochrobactrum phage ORM_20]